MDSPDDLLPDEELTPPKRRRGTYPRKKKTICPHGHPMTGDNVEIAISHGRKTRRCRTCHKESARQYRQRKKD